MPQNTLCLGVFDLFFPLRPGSLLLLALALADQLGVDRLLFLDDDVVVSAAAVAVDIEAKLRKLGGLPLGPSLLKKLLISLIFEIPA